MMMGRIDIVGIVVIGVIRRRQQSYHCIAMKMPFVIVVVVHVGGGSHLREMVWVDRGKIWAVLEEGSDVDIVAILLWLCCGHYLLAMISTMLQ